ncbi:Cell division cycle 5-like protein [Hordeum vulgare]|nr:Cell division cycle 5-like protein [Hordeum vulgare]
MVPHIPEKRLAGGIFHLAPFPTPSVAAHHWFRSSVAGELAQISGRNHDVGVPSALFRRAAASAPRMFPSYTAREPPPEMELSPCEKFSLDGSSDSDDSDVETMLLTFRQQTLVMALASRKKKLEPKEASRITIDHLCIPRNRHLGNEMLMQDYFTDNPIYMPHLFWRRYRMRRYLFVKIVQP